jgi:hypothetical protein
MNDKANNIRNTPKNIPGKYLYFTTISTAQETDLISKVNAEQISEDQSKNCHTII